MSSATKCGLGYCGRKVYDSFMVCCDERFCSSDHYYYHGKVSHGKGLPSHLDNPIDEAIIAKLIEPTSACEAFVALDKSK